MVWYLYICTDCDTDDGVVIMQKPEDVNPEASCEIDYCPGCDSYLSMMNMGKVEVTGNSLVHLSMREPAETDG